jgi:hypothetical protein
LKQICLFTIFFLYAVFNSQAQRLLNNRFSNIQLKDSVKVFTKPLSIIPTNFYNSQLGFICKKELLLEKKTKIPLGLDWAVWLIPICWKERSIN